MKKEITYLVGPRKGQSKFINHKIAKILVKKSKAEYKRKIKPKEDKTAVETKEEKQKIETKSKK